MRGLPSGTVTFLFTDVEGSTRLLQQHPDAMKAALARHHTLLADTVAAHGGAVFQVVGDGMCVAFGNAADALAAALAAQRALFGEAWHGIASLRVRMGLHTGAAEARAGEYLSSLTLARTQRVTAAGHGGQTLLSAAAAGAVRDSLPAGTTLRDLGAHKLRGLTEPETIFELVASDLPSAFPPLAVEAARSSPSAPLRELVRGEIVGRDAEARALRNFWELSQQARGQLVLLSGEPGVGKTRLAQDLIAHAQRDGATLLRGGCYEFEATTPYLPFVEAFRDWTRRQSPSDLRRALGTTASEIAKLAPEIAAKLGELPANAALPPGEERLRLFDNVARFLAALTADSGLLLFIDDLHWADQGTLSLLHYLLRHLRNDRILVLGAYREIELDRAHPLAAALVEWNRERLATRVALGRLSRVDTGALLATMFGMQSISEEFVAALYRETEGNPFFVEEVVKSLIEQGEIYREATGWGRKQTHELGIPQSVKEAIGRRLSRLADGTVEVLRNAAALGKRFRFGELAAVTLLAEDALLDALDEASAAQLIRVDQGSAKANAPSDDGFAFTHDKIREVLNEEANPIRRRRLHQRIGEAMENLYGAASEEHAQDFAHHFMQAGDLARSLTYAQRAAQNAKRLFAHDEALQFLAQARESAEALQRPDALPAIDEEVADIHAARGTTAPAVASYERALAGGPSPPRVAAIKAKIGGVYCAVGDPRGVRYLEQALDALDPVSQTGDLALATALMGRYHHYRTEHHKAIEWLERARVLAEPLDDPDTLSTIQAFRAGAHQHLLEYDESDRWARASIALGERKRFPVAIANGYEFLGENASARGHWDEAIADGAKDFEEGTKAGSLARVGWAKFCIAQGLHGKGALAEARDLSEEALALCEEIGEIRLATWLAPLAASIYSDLGDHERARSLAERNLARVGELEQLLLTAWALHGVGYAAMLRGDLAAAVAAYERYLPLVRETENGVAKLLILPHCADAFARAGRLDEADGFAAQAIALADFANAPHRWALARGVQGDIHARRGEADAAARAYDEAIARFAQLGSALELSRATSRKSEISKEQR